MSEQNPVKVAVLGATGGIGQPLSLLLKLSPLVDHVALYDILNTSGVAADLSHITSKAKVTHHQGAEQLEEALKGCTVVSIPAGIAQKPGMTRDDLFKVNAGIVKALAEACAKYCPKAILTIIANPVNSAVPIVCEVFKKAGVFDPKRILGVTTLDVVRATTFIAEMKKLDMTKVKVPVIGGHSRNTILPLLSQTEPETSFTQSEIESMTDKVRFAGEEVLNAKAGTGSATLSMAYAGARIVFSLLKALQGESDIVECAYVLSDVTDVKYFSTPLLLGKNGWEKNLGLGKLSEFEKKKLSELLPELQKQIKKGEDFMVSH